MTLITDVLGLTVGNNGWKGMVTVRRSSALSVVDDRNWSVENFTCLADQLGLRHKGMNHPPRGEPSYIVYYLRCTWTGYFRQQSMSWEGVAKVQYHVSASTPCVSAVECI